MELILMLVLGLIAGVAIGNAVGTVRTVRRRRPRDLAIDAELQAARQRAERAAGEAQALRTKLAAADVVSAHVAELEADLAAAHQDAERNAVLSTRLESEIATLRGGRRTRAGDPDGTGTRRSAAPSARSSAPAPLPDPTVPVAARGAVVNSVAGSLPQPMLVTGAPPAIAETFPDTDASDRTATPAIPVEPEATLPPAVSYGLGNAPVVAPDDPARDAEVSDVPVRGATIPMTPVRPRRAAPSGPTDGDWSPVQPPPTEPMPPTEPPPPPIEPSPAPVAPAASMATSPVAPDPDPSPAPGPVEVAPAPHPHGWRPIRPGLSDPWTWLDTTSPAGIPYAEDDLQSVHGVGPYLARRLREEGVLTWRQVAEWDEDDMTLVSRRIGSFPDRIRREDWSGAARELHQARYGERLP